MVGKRCGLHYLGLRLALSAPRPTVTPVLGVDQPKPVMVEQTDGVWPGWLSAWRRSDAG